LREKNVAEDGMNGSEGEEEIEGDERSDGEDEVIDGGAASGREVSGIDGRGASGEIWSRARYGGPWKNGARDDGIRNGGIGYQGIRRQRASHSAGEFCDHASADDDEDDGTAE
jgi:hypothetical protein